MNLLQLILKQMRQRALSTFLTCFSIILGMALATSIMVVGSQGQSVLAQTDYGFDLLIGPKGSETQLVLNTVYHVGTSPGNIPYALYENMTSGADLTPDGKPNLFQGMVRWAVPYAVGDSYKGRRIVGTTANLFGVDDEGQPLPATKIPEYRQGDRYTFAQGRPFHGRKFEAVIGSEVAAAAGLALGSTFHATHGMPGPNDVIDEHDEIWTVVGVLNQTHTASDRVLFIPLLSFYAIFEHEEGLQQIAKVKADAGAKDNSPPAAQPATTQASPEKKAYRLNPDGTIEVLLPKAQWEISAILAQTKSAATMLILRDSMRNLPDAMAVNPAAVMVEFFSRFMAGPFQLLILISALVTVVGAVSILVSIYNSVAGRSREIAIMRALGATRIRILAIVCLEAGIVGAIGGVIGLLLGHGLAAVGSIYMRAWLGTGIAWWVFWWAEGVYLLIVIAVSLLAGLVPALKAYKTPVAENLAAS